MTTAPRRGSLPRLLTSRALCRSRLPRSPYAIKRGSLGPTAQCVSERTKYPMRISTISSSTTSVHMVPRPDYKFVSLDPFHVWCNSHSVWDTGPARRLLDDVTMPQAAAVSCGYTDRDSDWSSNRLSAAAPRASCSPTWPSQTVPLSRVVIFINAVHKVLLRLQIFGYGARDTHPEPFLIRPLFYDNFRLTCNRDVLQIKRRDGVRAQCTKGRCLSWSTSSTTGLNYRGVTDIEALMCMAPSVDCTVIINPAGSQ